MSEKQWPGSPAGHAQQMESWIKRQAAHYRALGLQPDAAVARARNEAQRRAEKFRAEQQALAASYGLPADMWITTY